MTHYWPYYDLESVVTAVTSNKLTKSINDGPMDYYLR